MTATNQTSWNTNVLLQRTSVNFKLHTGAEVTAITEETFKRLNGITISKPYKSLHDPARQSLNVFGQFTGVLSVKNRHLVSYCIDPV